MSGYRMRLRMFGFSLIVTLGMTGCPDDDPVTSEGDTSQEADAGADIGVDSSGADAGTDTQADATVDEPTVDMPSDQADVGSARDLPDLVLPPDFGFIDGTYADGPSEPPIENCVDEIDNDGDTNVDCDDPDCSLRLICTMDPFVEEVEPNEGWDDGQLISLGDIVVGEIGMYHEDEEGERDEDRDWYRFVIEEPTLLAWEFDDANSLAVIQNYLRGIDDETRNRDVVRVLDSDTPGTRREVFLPIPGTYAVEFRDRRNFRVGSDEFHYGGDLFDYAFRLEALTPEPEAVALPFNRDAQPLASGNPVSFFEVDIASGEMLEVEITSHRLDRTAGYDSTVYVIDTADGSIVHWEDNPPLSTRDAFLRTGVFWDALDDAWIVVDAYEIEHTSDHAIRIEQVAINVDHEPNDNVAIPVEITGSSPFSGEIGAPFLRYTTTVTDRDIYWIPNILRHSNFLVTVEPNESAEDVDLAVRTGLSNFGTRPSFAERFLADPEDTRGVRLEALSTGSAFFIEVSDRNNLLDDEVDPVGGGSGFEYTLRVDEITGSRVVTAITLPHDIAHDLTDTGQADWYSVDMLARRRVRVEATSADEGFEPFLFLNWNDDNVIKRASDSVYHYAEIEREFRIGVVDQNASVPDNWSYDLTVEDDVFQVYTVSDVTDASAVLSNGVDCADTGICDRYWVDGVTAGDNLEGRVEDTYTVTLGGDQLLFVETYRGVDTEMRNANTWLRVEGDGLAEAIEDNDDSWGTYSLIEAIEVPAEGGSYSITVFPHCGNTSCSNGDYSLIIWTEPAL